jgi:hypothetical protein
MYLQALRKHVNDGSCLPLPRSELFMSFIDVQLKELFALPNLNKLLSNFLRIYIVKRDSVYGRLLENILTDLGLLDDEEFWAWLCVRHGWKIDIWGWIKEHCPQHLGEDYNAYIYRAMKHFNASEPLDRELYYNLIQFISIACDPNILEFPHIAQYATKACQQA